MIKREQIEKLRKAHVVVGRNGARFVAVSEADYEALCVLALEQLDMEPRPIEEAPKDGKSVLARYESQESEWFIVHYDDDVSSWVDDSGTAIQGWGEPITFIPLSSLPKAKPAYTLKGNE